MSQVIEILTSLGIDSTVYFQFGIFSVAFISMKYIVFNPYLAAYDERVRQTVGGQEEAHQLLEEAEKQEALFAAEAKKLNGRIKEIFGTFNLKAKKEVEDILGTAKKEAEAQTELARKELEASVADARKEMESHIPEISSNIQNKFVRQ